jgi:formate dehydrogenase major subunit
MDAHDGKSPFILLPDGKGWLFVPTGLQDGPLPTHYEPMESPVPNLLYPKWQTNPIAKIYEHERNQLAQVGDPQFPIVLTTYRLTEHHLSGAMSRWLPWLAELQPELFVEISPELAQEKGIQNLDWVRITSKRGSIVAKALVTPRLRPLMVNGKTVHQIGMPWHWGFMGLSTGDVVNDLTSWVADPNVMIHEAKALLVNVEKAK